MYCITTFVNTVPSRIGVSAVHSPQEIVTQHKLDIAKDYKVQFGAYVEVSDNAVITHDMKSRTTKCIALSSSEN